MFEVLRKLIRPPRLAPCAHQETIEDQYRDQVVVTCCACGEVWLSGLPDWAPVRPPRELEGFDGS